jgi:plastocyanin
MKLRRSLLLVPVLALAAAGAFAQRGSASGPPTVTGTVGPGFTITLTRNGKRVKTLAAGRYTFKIVDRASVHNFVLEKSGGAFEKQLTSVPFTGSKSVVVRLTKGKWEFYCAPHESQMHGDLRVT